MHVSDGSHTSLSNKESVSFFSNRIMASLVLTRKDLDRIKRNIKMIGIPTLIE